jgi:hypothetical protein
VGRHTIVVVGTTGQLKAGVIPINRVEIAVRFAGVDNFLEKLNFHAMPNELDKDNLRFYVLENESNNRTGPLSREDLLLGIVNKKYKSTTYAWTGGLKDWLKLSDAYWDKIGIRVLEDESFLPPPLPSEKKIKFQEKMPMVNCEECDKEISSKAASCPHCGCPTHNKFKGILGKGKDFFEKSKDKLDKLLDDEPQDEVIESKGILGKGKDFFEKSKDKLDKLLDDEPQDEVIESNKRKDDEKPKKIQNEPVDEVKYQGDSDEKSEETSAKQSDSKPCIEDSSGEDKAEKKEVEVSEENASANVQEKDSDEETSDNYDNAVVQSMSGEGKNPVHSSHSTKKEKKNERTNEGSTQECPKCKSVINRSAAVCPECKCNPFIARFYKSRKTLTYGILGGLIFQIPFFDSIGWITEQSGSCMIILLLPNLGLFILGCIVGMWIAIREQTKRFLEGENEKALNNYTTSPKIKYAFIATIAAILAVSFWPGSESAQEEDLNVKTNGSKAYAEISVTHGGYDSVFQTTIMKHIHAVSTSVDDDVLTLDITINWINSDPLKLNDLYMEKGGKFTIEGIRLSTPRKFSKIDYASSKSMMNENQKIYEFGWLGIKFKLYMEDVLTKPMPFEQQQLLGGWI